MGKKKQKVKNNQTGRPSTPNVQRYPCGKIKPEYRTPRGETETQIKSTVLSYRRRTMSEDDAGRSEAGYSAGRLFLRGILKRWHHEAAKEYARLVHDYQISQGYPSPFPRSMDIGAVHGLSLHGEPDADIVRRVATQYMRSMTALSDAGKTAASEVRNVCIYDEDPMNLDALLIGLDSLVNFFGIPVDRPD